MQNVCAITIVSLSEINGLTLEITRYEGMHVVIMSAAIQSGTKSLGQCPTLALTQTPSLEVIAEK